MWEAHIKPSTLLAKITPALIEDVKLRRAQAVTHSTVDKDLAVLKAFFNWCIARSLAASNPVSRVKFFNEDNSRLRYLTEDEYNRLIEAAKTIETSPCLAEKIILSVHTGLRRGSLFSMRWDYVDFLNRVVRIPRTKSGRPHAIPLNATVLTTLQALYTERTPDCAYVFAHATGRKGRGAGKRREERVPHGARDGQDQRLHVARSAAHFRVVANHEGCLASIGGRAPRPSRSAHGHAIRASLAGVPVSRSEFVGSASIGTAAHAAHGEKGKKRATSHEARSAPCESRQISERNWLLGLDSNQQPSG